ncbi:MAG: hypothetical protein WBP26_05100 [Candidatus Saccharimonadales bacterium]
MSHSSHHNQEPIDLSAALSGMIADGQQRRRVTDMTSENFAQHVNGDLPDRARVLRADMAGITTTELARHNRSRITETQRANGVGLVGRLGTRLAAWHEDAKLGRRGEVVPGITSAEITERIRQSGPLIPTQAEPGHDVVELPLKGSGISGQELGSIDDLNSMEDVAEAGQYVGDARNAQQLDLIKEMDPQNGDFLRPPQSPAQIALGHIKRPFIR